MALTAEQRMEAATLAAQGETRDRIAKYLGVPVEDVKVGRTAKAATATETKPAED